MVDFLGCEHHLITLNNKDLADALYMAVDARDLPGMADVDSSLLLFCKEICCCFFKCNSIIIIECKIIPIFVFPTHIVNKY